MRWVDQLFTGTGTASCRDTKVLFIQTRKHYNLKPTGLSTITFRFSHPKILNEEGQIRGMGVVCAWGEIIANLKGRLPM